MPRDRLRVVHIITKLELGGAQQNTLYTVTHLDRSFFEPYLICGEGGILDQDARSLPDVSVHFCSPMLREIHPWNDWVAYRSLKSLLEKIEPDIVHTHSSKAGILGRLAASAAKVPVVIHSYHGFGFHSFQNPLVFRLYLEVEKEACRRAHHLIFVSKDNWKWAQELHLLQGATASLIRSGVKADPLLQATGKKHLREKLGIPEDVKLVGMIACLKPQKDPLTYVKVADLVTQRMPNVYFVLVGDGELCDIVLRNVSRMKHRNRFLHFGWRRDVPDLLANFDLMLLTSLWEGLPRVILEATIAGVPTVASNIDGNREIVFEGRNGNLAEPRNAEDFAEKTMKALREEWKVDSELAREIRTEFDIDEMVRKQEDLYRKLASASRV